ncbi:hypothetical protein BIW11_05654 [Tropilaelaps mercedesae]|uniref:Uncharacterized protein n=1 Tax=Tropilaelaps mercedesae TaxID=418985 RepID=A0A1V9Y1H0_9ACAR|nr:hypothetical protein BIW11_05654 [Tropilaelaps mercedesae]
MKDRQTHPAAYLCLDFAVSIPWALLDRDRSNNACGGRHDVELPERIRRAPLSSLENQHTPALLRNHFNCREMKAVVAARFGLVAVLLAARSTEGFILKKATKVLGGYALVKALEPKPPQMVGVMMPMPVMPIPEAMPPMMDDKPSPAAMMAMMNGMMMMMMDKKPAMKEPTMEMQTPTPSMDKMADMMKMMNNGGEGMKMTNGQVNMTPIMSPPVEPSERRVLAAVHALEHGHHHAIPRDIHIH